MKDGWQEEVLGFWFDDLTPEDWWSGTSAVDDKVRRFAGLHAELAGCDPAGLATSPRAALAAVIALDQFPRNIFRGEAEAFSTDAAALRVSAAAMDQGFDAALEGEEKAFLYMPFLHSERLPDQDRAVALFDALGIENHIDFAKAHRDIIVRFGRFPHRNRVLGRVSTEAEQSFLAEHKGFGQ